MNRSSSASLQQGDPGNLESVGGIAGDSTIGISEIIGANHSTTGDGSLPSKKATRGDSSFYENDSVMIWSDDVEKEYFTYILSREAAQRAKQQKAEVDSLMGQSTLDEIKQEFTKWHEGGGESRKDPTGGSPLRQTLDGFSLATTEKKSIVKAQGDVPDTSPRKDKKLLPDVIYVTDTPATSLSTSKPSEGSLFRGAGGRKCLIASLFLMGGCCLAAAAVGIYIAITTKRTNNSNIASSIQEGTPIVWGAYSSSPTMSPSQGPSQLPPIRTKAPEHKEPTMLPIEAQDTAPPAPQPSTIASGRIPTTTTTSNPSRPPTKQPATSPSLRPSVDPSTAPCGCKRCELALNRIADGYSCNDRIHFLMHERGYTELGACRLVAGAEFPNVCGPFCNPDSCEVADAAQPSSHNRGT